MLIIPCVDGISFEFFSMPLFSTLNFWHHTQFCCMQCSCEIQAVIPFCGVLCVCARKTRNTATNLCHCSFNCSPFHCLLCKLMIIILAIRLSDTERQMQNHRNLYPYSLGFSAARKGKEWIEKFSLLKHRLWCEIHSQWIFIKIIPTILFECILFLWS